MGLALALSRGHPPVDKQDQDFSSHTALAGFFKFYTIKNKGMAMDIKKLIVICFFAVTLSVIGGGNFIYAQAGAQESVPKTDTGSGAYEGMQKNDLLKIFGLSHVKKYEKRGNEEVFVFDDILTSNPDDTVTFYLVDGRVKAWDKNKIIFPDDSESKSAIYVGMPREELYKIYAPGNVKKYEKKGREETLMFDDILTSNSDDILTFHLKDGKVTSWGKDQNVITPEERLKAVMERSKYATSYQSGSSQGDSSMKSKEQNRLAHIRNQNRGWNYNRGLYYR